MTHDRIQLMTPALLSAAYSQMLFEQSYDLLTLFDEEIITRV